MRISDWSSDVCSSDLFETAVAWKAAIERDTGPAALALSRQNLDAQPRSEQQQADAERGGYVLWEPKSAPEAVIIATGSEVQLAVKAAAQLADKGRGRKRTRLNSSHQCASRMPSSA